MGKFSSSPHYDPTITSEVRTVLFEAGREDLVSETIINGMRDIEKMTRRGLKEHADRLALLEEANRERLTKTSVLEIIKLRAAAEASGWMKWGTRAALGGFGAAALSFVAWVLQLAWRGYAAK